MSIIDTLITDRSAADLTELRSLLAVPFAQWTEEQKKQFKLAVSKGAYNASDLNRVTDACEYLAAQLRSYGYSVNVKRPSIKETIVTPSESVLPEGYTELAWIESTGTQYIDTGISVPHASAKVWVRFSTESTAQDAPITGHAYGTWSWTTNMLAAGGNGMIVVNATGTTTAVIANTIYEVEYTNSYYKIDGTQYTQAYNGIDGYNDTIFYGNGKYGKYRLYKYKLYNGESLIRDCVPCINSNGEIGLYDIVNSVFYGNAGSGTFAAGEVVDIPEGGGGSTTIERDYWKIGDIPQWHHMEEYLQNINNLRASLELASGTPDTPTDMDNLTIQEANDIELILVDVQTLLNNIAAAWFYSGEIYSGEVM